MRYSMSLITPDMKGISPLIAGVLLIAVTVAMATLISGWISTVTRSSQSSAENKTLSAIECAAASVVVDNVYISQGSNGSARVILRNSGQANDLQTVSAELYDKNGNNFSANNTPITSFNRGSLATITFQFPEFPNTTTDSSNYGNNATLGTAGTGYGNTNDPTWTSEGKFNKALVFDGANDFVNATGSEGGVLNMTGTALTIEMWVKINNVTQTSQEMLFKGSSTTPSSYGFRMSGQIPSNIVFTVSNSTNAKAMISKISPSPDVWYHIAGTYNGSNMSLFINGVLDNVTNHNNNINSTHAPLTIGRDSASPNYVNGTIDEVAIWNRSLTNDEINSSMNNGVLSVSNINDLLGYWEFDNALGIVSCPGDFSKVIVSTNCGGVSAEFTKTPRC